jgi:hypothetical protein
VPARARVVTCEEVFELTTTGLGHNRILTDSAVVSTAVAFLRGQDVTNEDLEATTVV